MFRNNLKNLLKTVHADSVVTRCLTPFHHEYSDMSENKAEEILKYYSAKPDGNCFTQNEIDEFTVDLQIIIPAYNVEKYLCKCLDSVLSQKTTYSYKVLVIEDGSTDGMKDIIARYAGDEHIIPIYQDNKEFSGARNSGLSKIFARYIMFIDSDDFLPKCAIDSLMKTAVETDADIVEGSAYPMTEGERDIYDQYRRRVNGYKGRLKGQPQGKVYKSSIFQDLCFPEGFWFEDSVNALIIYPNSENMVVIPEFVYTYRMNPDGISATASRYRKIVDTYWVTTQLVEDYQKGGYQLNSRFMEALMRQIIINFRRTKTLEKDIQEAVFVLSSKLLKSLGGGQKSIPYKCLYRALEKKDYGAYKVCVSYYLL